MILFVSLPFQAISILKGKPFDRPFDKLTVLSKVEGLTVLSKVEGLTVLSKVEGLTVLSKVEGLTTLTKAEGLRFPHPRPVR
jgi:hypothetical protein